MALTDLIPPGGAVADLPGTSRKQVLQALCDLAQRTLHVPSRTVLDAVMERERLGSTGVGDGVGHTPCAHFPGGSHVRCVRAAEDAGRFRCGRWPSRRSGLLLLAPEDSGAEHLKALARVARLFPPRGYPHGPARWRPDSASR